MNEKHKKFAGYWITLRIFLFLFLLSVVVFKIYAFVSLVGVPLGKTISAVGIKICAITAGIKKIFQSLRKKNTIV